MKTADFNTFLNEWGGGFNDYGPNLHMLDPGLRDLGEKAAKAKQNFEEAICMEAYLRNVWCFLDAPAN